LGLLDLVGCITSLTEITKRAISAITKEKATDLKAVAPHTIEVKKAWIVSSLIKNGYS